MREVTILNELVKYLYDAGLSQPVYWAFHVLGFVAVFIFVVWFGTKIHMKPWQSAITVLIVFPIVYGFMYVQSWIESGFTTWGGNNIVRVFPYIPIPGLIITAMFKIKWKDICHLLAYAPLVVHGTSHFGCIFGGCCIGYPSPWGLYFPATGATLFPIQPIEALAAWAILAVLLVRAKRRRYISDGLEYPIMLILFGSTRFIFEFFRDNGKLWLGCSGLAFHALFMFIVGIIAYVLIKKKIRTNETQEV